MRAIAARAGVAVGTVYRRFANKRALLLAAQNRFLARRATRVNLTRHLARLFGHSAERSAGQFVNGAILAVERDRPLLRAFATASSSDAAIHSTVIELIEQASGRPVRPIVIDVILLALRALVLDGTLPSETTPVRKTLTSYLSGLIRADAPSSSDGSGRTACADPSARRRSLRPHRRRP